MFDPFSSFILGIIGISIAFGFFCFVYDFFPKEIPAFFRLWLSAIIVSGSTVIVFSLPRIFSSLSIFFLNVISQTFLFITLNQLWIYSLGVCIALLFTFVAWKKSIADQKDRKISESSRVVQNLIDTLNNKWEKWEQ